MKFDRHQFGKLRAMFDCINDWDREAGKRVTGPPEVGSGDED